MIVDRIQDLCRKENITISYLEGELGFGNGTIRRWDENIPSIDKVLKVANYFNAPIDSLIRETERR